MDGILWLGLTLGHYTVRSGTAEKVKGQRCVCCEVTYGLLEVRLSSDSLAGQGQARVIHGQAQDRACRDLSGGVQT